MAASAAYVMMREGALPEWAETRPVRVARCARRIAPDPGLCPGARPNLPATTSTATGGGWVGGAVGYRSANSASDLRIEKFKQINGATSIRMS
jgi:hypothetical protein